LKLAIVGAVVGAIVIALGAKTLVDDSTAPTPPKPYDEAMYDVYSDLLQESELPEKARQIIALAREAQGHPQPEPPEGILIRVETLTFQEPGTGGNPTLPRGLGNFPEEERFKPAVDSAIADYLKRNEQPFQLQRKFNLSKYDLFTKDEEQAFLRGDPSACQKYSGYMRWVELSAVGFNEDQTVAVVHFIDWGGHPCSNTLVGATGKDRMLQKRDGKWHLLPSRIFSDWILN